MGRKTNLQKYEDADFIKIKNGEIRWLGYFYNSNGWHLLEYSYFYTKIENYIKKYARDAATAYNEYGYRCKQYICSETENPETYDKKWFQNEINRWLKKAKRIKETEIMPDTPDGYYVIVPN